MFIKRFFILSTVFILLFTLNVNAAESNITEQYSWFCVHRKDHLQPASDPSFDFIEDHGGYYIDKKHSDASDEKVIYLTFDVGYENGNVAKILDVMKAENVSGAFFILGHVLEAHTDLVIRMFEEGHLVCNHTFSHNTMVGKSEDDFTFELQKLEAACLELTGKEISNYYRPPEGRFDEKSLIYAERMGYKTIFWSFAYADWDNNKQMSCERAKTKILENIHNGEIMLLHPTSATNAEIIREIIRELKDQGYRFGSLDEL